MKRYGEIQERLKCRPFRWLLEHVNPEIGREAKEMFVEVGDGRVSFRRSGWVRNNGTGTCLDDLNVKVDSGLYGVFPCHYQGGSQSTAHLGGKQIMTGAHALKGRLARGEDGRLQRTQCSNALKTRQVWDCVPFPNQESKTVRIVGNGLCLTVVSEAEVEKVSPFSLRMNKCGGVDAMRQSWEWERSARVRWKITSQY